MIEFLLWAFCLYGFVQIVTYSDLLDGFRDWYMKKSGYPKVGGHYVKTSTDEPNPQSLYLKVIFKLTMCWLCVSFWAGIASSLLHFGPYQNPLASGLAAVGVLSVFKFVTERQSGG